MSSSEEKSETREEFSQEESFKTNPSSNIFRSGISKRKLRISKTRFYFEAVDEEDMDSVRKTTYTSKKQIGLSPTLKNDMVSHFIF